MLYNVDSTKSIIRPAKITTSQLVILLGFYIYFICTLISLYDYNSTNLEVSVDWSRIILSTYLWLWLVCVLDYALTFTSHSLVKPIAAKATHVLKMSVYTSYIGMMFLLFTQLHIGSMETGFVLLNFLSVLILGSMTLILFIIHTMYFCKTIWYALLSIPYCVIQLLCTQVVHSAQKNIT